MKKASHKLFFPNFYFINFIILFTLFYKNLTVSAQESQSGILTENISTELSRQERPPVNIDLNIGYQSNIDLLDRNLYEVKYSDNTVMNVNANTTFKSSVMGNQLTHDTSLNSEFVYSDSYDKNSDFIRRATFKNNFFLNLMEEDSKIDFGPTLSLNVEKRYTRPGFYRKRDNATGFTGLKAIFQPTSKLTITPESSIGYLDHNGTYVPPLPNRFAYERNLEEDRVINKNSISTTYNVNEHLTFTMPISLNRDIYKERRARYAEENIDTYHAMALAQWSSETGRPFIDPTLDLQTFSTGLSATINLDQANLFEVGYTYIDEREKNVGHRYSDTDNDVLNFSMTTTPRENITFSLGYENYDTRFYRLWGGGKEITQTYSTKLAIVNFMKSDVKAVFNFSYADYQLTLPSISYQERASNSIASIGLVTTI